MASSIDSFKANLKFGGARANQYRVFVTPPSFSGLGLNTTVTSFLCTATNLPASTLGEIAIPFRGRNVYISGDRPAPDAWSTTFYNDTDFMIRNAMELWQNGINDYANNTGVTNPSDYQTDLFVEQLDADDTILKSYIFRNAYPLTIGAIELTSAEAGEIETFPVTWRYQHFEPSGVSF